MARYKTNPHNVDAIQVNDVNLNSMTGDYLVDSIDAAFSELPKWFLIEVAKQHIVPYQTSTSKIGWRYESRAGSRNAIAGDWIINDPVSGIQVIAGADFAGLYTINP
jgi:hypothetical protein